MITSRHWKTEFKTQNSEIYLLSVLQNDSISIQFNFYLKSTHLEM